MVVFCSLVMCLLLLGGLIKKCRMKPSSCVVQGFGFVHVCRHVLLSYHFRVHISLLLVGIVVFESFGRFCKKYYYLLDYCDLSHRAQFIVLFRTVTSINTGVCQFLFGT